MLARGGLFGFIFRQKYRRYFIKTAVNRLIDRFIDIFYLKSGCKKERSLSRSSRRELRQLNKSLRICDIRLTTSDIAFRPLYSPDGELRIYLI